ncbi:MAG: hypothetical protein FGM32_03730 [Candidatus Kapabacteria bacterium]|nr:hypothetical protein [Candidatus Kapabacteria bacterium]
MTRHADQPSISIRLAWSPNVARGFVGALIIMAMILGMMTCTRFDADPIVMPKTAPVTLLVLGSGDGTGMRKGNLTAEGAAQKGAENKDPLVDAAKSSGASKTPTSDPALASKFIPKDQAGKGGKTNDEASSDVAIGSAKGSDQGTGLGELGVGRGKGDGFGDIDWGGGGNRTVVTKVIPTFPPGVLDTKVKIRFRVASNGSVTTAWPEKKGGSRLVEQAAIQALMRWRFNRLATETEMEGVITFMVNYR